MQGETLGADAGGMQSYQHSGPSSLIPILQSFYPIGRQQQLQQTGSTTLSHCQDYFGRKARQVHRPGMVLQQVAPSPHLKLSYITSFTSKLNNNYEINTKRFNFLNALFHVKKKIFRMLYISFFLPTLPFQLQYFQRFYSQSTSCLPNLILQIPSHVIFIYLCITT